MNKTDNSKRVAGVVSNSQRAHGSEKEGFFSRCTSTIELYKSESSSIIIPNCLPYLWSM